MKRFLPLINAKNEADKVVKFLRGTLPKQNIPSVVIGISGGVDSTTSLYLLRQALDPRHIFPIHMPYFPQTNTDLLKLISHLKIPIQNFQIISIREAAKFFRDLLFEQHLRRSNSDPLVNRDDNYTSVRKRGELSRDKNFSRFDQTRLGNIMARLRMIILFDQAKKHNALVCGTENKSEHLLGYFTRFGDQASDIEPIQHLYKTQVYQLAVYLKVPKEIIGQKPTAGLWKGQTDEDEFGFTYKEADHVLHLYFDKKLPLERIKNLGFSNASKIISLAKKNSFKHQTPYRL